MPFSDADYLPSFEELEVEEINLSSAPLRAASHHLGKYCDNQSKEFMLCVSEEKDPRKCIYEGKEVTRCGLEFFRKVKGSCAESFEKYWKCVDMSGYNMRLDLCRLKQKEFDQCVMNTLGQERPQNGYFSRIRSHETTRPKPTYEVPFPEPTPEPPNPADQPVPDSAKYGSRAIFR